MKTGLWIGIGVGLTVVLVVGGLALGSGLIARRLWAAGPTPEYAWSAPPCIGWGYGEEFRGTASGTISLAEARQAIERYITDLGYPNLEIDEVMEFERNFYAIVRESDTGIGAMELLVDKWSGVVGPEIGPNMMWNGKYGMHGCRGMGMMGGAAITNTIPPEKALQIAQRWLDAYRPGTIVEEHADPFYGYYTIHTLKDGRIEGMLSVHGTTGQVWYHTWHGSFIQLIEDH